MTPECDHCPKRAVRNYQRIWHIFKITRGGEYVSECVDYELEEPVDDSNRHLCAEHEAAFLAGDL